MTIRAVIFVRKKIQVYAQLLSASAGVYRRWACHLKTKDKVSERANNE